MLELQHAVPLGIFSAYFITILTLFSLIFADLWSLSKKLKLRTSSPTNAVVFIGLTIASLIHTWYYMLKYMTWSFANYELGLLNPGAHDLLHRLAFWLHDTSLFKEAWALVCFHPVNWWWSEQLCLFTAGAWTVFIAVEGKHHKIKHLWAYMLLGQIVAISVASNLFYLAILLSQPSLSIRDLSLKKSVSSRLVFSVLLSLGTVVLSPFTSHETFLPNLLVMHALLFVPLISTTPEVSSSARFSTISLKTLYRIIHLVCAGIRLRSVMVAIGSLQSQTSSSPQPSMVPLDIFREAWTTLHSHPAQSSIGWDIIWTSLSFLVWILLRPGSLVDNNNSSNNSSRDSEIVNKYGIAAYLMLATPVASIAVTAPYALRPRGDVDEGVRAVEVDSEEKKR